MQEIFDYEFYARHFLKIQTKVSGIKPLHLRKYQLKFIKFLDSIKGPVRVIVVKPRQAGFSTIVASKFFHMMATDSNFKGLGMADKSDRTLSIRKIYSFFLQQLPPSLIPMISKNNTKEIEFDNPDFNARLTNPGLASGVKFETALDPNAGRSESRKFAHLSENAFYLYYTEIDDGVQNSIPLVDGTFIAKESTANGRAGTGRPFYLLYNAAKRNESIYKPFFVAWYEVDDYAITPSKRPVLTKYEKEIAKQYPLTIQNLMWRRLKIMEYLNDEEECYLTPEERFKQDFPLSDEEAFLHTGQPVFPHEVVNSLISSLTNFRPNDIKERLKLNDQILKQFWDQLTIYTPQRKGKTYFIGADVAEGLAQGDSSSLYVMDENYVQVAKWHGKIDADLFGHLLIALGEIYNDALLIVENNNMGHTTITTLKNNYYPRIYAQTIEDRQTKKKAIRYGWMTTGPSKNDMINEGIARLRDGNSKILDVALPTQMSTVTRGENGIVELNGKDRVVAYCLACIGRKHYSQALQASRSNSRRPQFGRIQTGQTEHDKWERQNKKRNQDIFD